MIDRPDETPKTFAELKAPGYWSKTLGYFVPVGRLTPEQAQERYEQLAEWFENDPEWEVNERFRPK